MNETKFRQQVQQLLKSQIQVGTMAQEYNLSEVCHRMDQGTFYTMLLEKTYFM